MKEVKLTSNSLLTRVMSLLLVELFFFSSILPAYAEFSDFLRPKPVIQRLGLEELAADGGLQKLAKKVLENERYMDALNVLGQTYEAWKTKTWIPSPKVRFVKARLLGAAEATRGVLERQTGKISTIVRQMFGKEIPFEIQEQLLSLDTNLSFLRAALILGKDADRAIENVFVSLDSLNRKLHHFAYRPQPPKFYQARDGGKGTLTSAVLAGSLLFSSPTDASIPKEKEPSLPLELKFEEIVSSPLIHILGHSYLIPEERHLIRHAVYRTEDLEKPSDDPSHGAYRDEVETILKTHEAIIQSRLVTLTILRKAIQEGKRVIIAAEHDPEEFQWSVENAEAELQRLVGVLRQRGVSEYQRKAEALYLLMYDEGTYLLATKQPILIFPLVDGEIHERLGILMTGFETALGELEKLAAASGVTQETVDQWHERAVQWAVEHKRIPEEAELKTLLEPFVSPQVKEKAGDLLKQTVLVLQTLEEKERRMAHRIHVVAQHEPHADLFVVVGTPRVEGLNQFLKEEKLRTTIEAKDGGVRFVPKAEALFPAVQTDFLWRSP